MLDYLNIEKLLSVDKGTPNFSNCSYVAHYRDGTTKYEIIGCEKIEMFWNNESRLLRLRGSFPYFIQGHNFCFEKATFVEAVEYLQTALSVGLWDSFVDEIEMGVIFRVDKKPSLFIMNHHAPQSSRFLEYINPQSRGALTTWKRDGDLLKMYDAGRNIKMKQGLHRRDVIRESTGWDPEDEYLKIEAHLNKPERVNNGIALTLEDCLDRTKYNQLAAHLCGMYNDLQPMKTLLRATDKKDFSALDIAARVITTMMNGCDPEAAKKAVYSMINNEGSDILAKADKDQRKRVFKAAFDKLKAAEISEYDLTDKLTAALDEERW